MWDTREGALNALANVRWHDLQVVVPEAIEGAEEASGNGSRVPAGVAIGVGAGIGDAKR